jgi:hypothetical protein
MKCENEDCPHHVPEDNIGRICAGNTDHLVETSGKGYFNYRSCSCCDKCRSECAEESHKDDTESF